MLGLVFQLALQSLKRQNSVREFFFISSCSHIWLHKHLLISISGYLFVAGNMLCCASFVVFTGWQKCTKSTQQSRISSEVVVGVERAEELGFLCGARKGFHSIHGNSTFFFKKQFLSKLEDFSSSVQAWQARWVSSEIQQRKNNRWFVVKCLHLRVWCWCLYFFFRTKYHKKIFNLKLFYLVKSIHYCFVQ